MESICLNKKVRKRVTGHEVNSNEGESHERYRLGNSA